MKTLETTFVANVSSRPSTDVLGSASMTPALSTSASMRGSVRWQNATHSATLARLDTSHSTNVARPFGRAASLAMASSSLRRASTYTSAPMSSSCWHTSKPMPALPPVTRAILPAMSVASGATFLRAS